VLRIPFYTAEINDHMRLRLNSPAVSIRRAFEKNLGTVDETTSARHRTVTSRCSPPTRHTTLSILPFSIIRSRSILFTKGLRCESGHHQSALVKADRLRLALAPVMKSLLYFFGFGDLMRVRILLQEIRARASQFFGLAVSVSI
jgi:hypothetical protein